MGAIKKAILWLIAVRFVAIPGYWLLVERYAPLNFLSSLFSNNYLMWSWANFDGAHYLSIAKFGYQIREGFPQYAFFPLLPILIKFMSWFAQDYLLSGLILGLICLIAVLSLLPKWFSLVTPKGTTLPLWFLLFAPGAVFLASIYTEVLFIALALGVFYFSEKKKWGSATIFTALATATRINGIFLVLFLLIKLIKNGTSKILATFYLLLSTSGLLAYSCYLYFKTGNPLSWYTSQTAWGKATATSPLVTASNYLRAVTVDFVPDLVHLVVIIEIVITLWAIYLVYQTIRNKLLSTPYVVYLLGNLLLPLATGSLGSMPRFFLLLFPTIVVIPRMSYKARFFLVAFYFILFSTGVILFTRGYWYG